MSSISSLIPDDEKRNILETTKDMLVRDVYRYCVTLGIDPDTIDIETYEAEIPTSRHEYVALENACKSLTAVNEKIEALG